MSARWDGGALLLPIAPDRTCGEDVEYTVLPSFDTYRLFGRTGTIEPLPDWEEVRSRAEQALASSKDLRVLVYLAAALLRTEGLAAFARTLAVAAEWVDAFWAQVYPLVDEDALLRRNALSCFADLPAVVDAVRRAPLASSRQHGTITLRDIEIASGQMAPGEGETVRDEAQINAAFGVAPADELGALQASVSEGLAALRRIEATMGSQGGPEAIPHLEPLSSSLIKIDRVLRAQLAMRSDVVQPAGTGDPVAASPGIAVAAPGSITSRQDAVRAIEAAAEFFRRNEPSSPVPLFLERAKRLVSKNFLEVLADIAPDGLSQARAVGGVQESE